MKTLSKLLLATTTIAILSSCGHAKQFSSCDDIANSLDQVYYNDLVKEWGEPIQKEVKGDTWYIKWSGVGINGVDKKMMFKTNFASTVEYPTVFEGVSCN